MIRISQRVLTHHTPAILPSQAISAKVLFDLLLVYGPAALGVRAVTEDNLDASTSSLSSEVDTSGEAVHTFIPQLFLRLRQSEREVCACSRQCEVHLISCVYVSASIWPLPAQAQGLSFAAEIVISPINASLLQLLAGAFFFFNSKEDTKEAI
jgi:hypothetical protein